MKGKRQGAWMSLRNLIIGCVVVIVVFQAYVVFTTFNRGSTRTHLRSGNSHWWPDLLHLNRLNELCLTKGDTVISWKPQQQTEILTQDMDTEVLLAELRLCPEVDIFLPVGIRSHGYCEDAMAYVKFLKTRALPMWVFNMEFKDHNGKVYTYFDLCPSSAVMFMNHYWDGLDKKSTFPPQKKIVLMPNVEMYELGAQHYQRADYVIAKTKDGYRRITNWYRIKGNNMRNTQVIYAQHTTSDPTTTAAVKAQEDPKFGPIAPKNFETLSVFHANGRSTQKNTPKILDCWHDRPDMPMLHVYSNDEPSNTTYWNHFKKMTPLNLKYHNGEFIEPAQFGKLMAEASVILCPSITEGFGHYINQARAAGALVVTTDAVPMNEFIDVNSGVLVKNAVARPTHSKVLMGNDDTEFDVTPNDICAAMDEILAMTPQERAQKAREGQQRYFDQLQFFSDRMEDFRSTLRSNM
ncbi:hypothetical protein LEN26_010694 [Aphanomyces euteiches]|nr:hypothetical protein LEN26_010694 [Aphanomyces euteiches]KAH9124488.1 hypothetical protein AeMF1_004764 [Aphanomyces euteiches]KAH9188727.1 hypothetical protein AeNC1_009301 [Aphanomyces euteiches]